MVTPAAHPIEIVLLAVLEELRGIRRDNQHARQPLAPDDPIVAAIHQAIGPGVFQTPDVLKRAKTDRTLRKTLQRGLKRTTVTEQALGRRLGAISRHPQGGRLRLQQISRDSRASLWVIVNVAPCSSPTPIVTIDTEAVVIARKVGSTR